MPPKHVSRHGVHHWSKLAASTFAASLLCVIVEGTLETAIDILPSLLREKIQALVFFKEVTEMTTTKNMKVVGHSISPCKPTVDVAEFISLGLELIDMSLIEFLF